MMIQILKLGGSVITDKAVSRVARKSVIKRLSREISSAKKRKDFRLVLVNGAGSFGHTPVSEFGLKEGMHDKNTRIGFTLVHKYVEDLNRILWDSLNEEGVVSIPVHPASFVIHEGRKILKFDTDVIENLLQNDITPLLYGDVVLDTVHGCSIISGDDIVPYLAGKLGAERICMGSNTDGIFDMDPRKFPKAVMIDEIVNENYESVLAGLSGSTHVDVTGGMREKVRKLAESVRGTECIIYNAEKTGNTEKALLGEKIGTKISIS